MNQQNSSDVIAVKSPPPGASWFSSVEFTSGINAGEIFRQVEVTFTDGTKSVVYVSNRRDGYFKQVFVPLELDHPMIANEHAPVNGMKFL